MNKLGIYEFTGDFGRQGTITGLFIAYSDTVNDLIDKVVYFGEVLGKHSEIYGRIEECDIELKSIDAQGISFIQKIFKFECEGTISGYNPLEYLDDSE